MPHDLPDGSKIAKNKTENESPWHVLFELVVDGVERVFLVNNEEPVTFDGNTYRPFPIGFEEMDESLAGDLPVLNISASNVTREVQAFLEHRGGLLGALVLIRIVNDAFLGDPAAAIGQRFTVGAATATDTSVSLRLSQMPFFDISMPHQIYSRNRCRFGFKSKECGWGFPSLPAGVTDSSSCDKTRNGENGCSHHGQLYTDAGETSLWPQRWGAFPSIPRRRV